MDSINLLIFLMKSSLLSVRQQLSLWLFTDRWISSLIVLEGELKARAISVYIVTKLVCYITCQQITGSSICQKDLFILQQVPVAIVEANLYHNYVYSQVYKNPMERGKYPYWVKAPPQHQLVTWVCKWYGDNSLVEQHPSYHLENTVSCKSYPALNMRYEPKFFVWDSIF